MYLDHQKTRKMASSAVAVATDKLIAKSMLPGFY